MSVVFITFSARNAKSQKANLLILFTSFFEVDLGFEVWYTVPMNTLRLALARKALAETQKRVDRLTRLKIRLEVESPTPRVLRACKRHLSAARRCLRVDADYLEFCETAAKRANAGASCARE